MGLRIGFSLGLRAEGVCLVALERQRCTQRIQTASKTQYAVKHSKVSITKVYFKVYYFVGKEV